MDNWQKHNKKVLELQQAVRALKDNSQKIVLKKRPLPKSSIKKTPENQEAHQLDTTALDQIVHIDVVNRKVYVEPHVTMDDLVKQTQAHHLVPKVVPEFKNITVGGAILGGALESTSFRYGQFNDCATAYKVLLGNGEVIWTSSTHFEDLHHGINGSYGTLAIIVLVVVELRSAQSHIKLYHQTLPMDAGLTKLYHLSKYSRVEFVEGISFDSKSLTIITGYFHTAHKKVKKKKWCSTLFYQDILHKKEALVSELDPDNPFKDDATSENTYVLMMHLYDYLFRYDKGAFWMGRYLANPSSLYYYNRNKEPEEKKLEKLIQSIKNIDHHKKMRFLRYFFGRKLSCEKLYDTLHKIPERLVKNHLLIQDFYIPFSQLNSFLNWLDLLIQMYPLWICPIKATTADQIFSPHRYIEEDLLVNVGIYGIPKAKQSARELIRLLEEKVIAIGGKKMLYGHNYYTKDAFWDLYPQEEYLNLRKKYKAENNFYSITDKILS